MRRSFEQYVGACEPDPDKRLSWRVLHHWFDAKCARASSMLPSRAAGRTALFAVYGLEETLSV